MELHTLGVDGGYTQKDVTEVARAFTGWTIDRRARAAASVSSRACTTRARRSCSATSSSGAAAASGRRTGARHSREASVDGAVHRDEAGAPFRQRQAPARRSIDRAAATLPRDRRRPARSRADDPAVAEFLAPATSYGAKVKTPFEFVVERAARDRERIVRDARPFVRAMQQLGMPLYLCQPPTGYADTADAWINTGALVARMNFATRLSGGDQQLALKLGSPDFQRR